MITHKIGNLLKAKDVHVICHQANLFHTFGAGIAASIASDFPEAFEADKKTEYGAVSKLGTYSTAKIKRPDSSLKYIVNMYSQVGLGGQDRHTSYDHMVTALTKLRRALEDQYELGNEYNLGIPYKIGAGLANGNWHIIKAIIEAIFENSPVQVFIYYLPEFANEMPKD